MTRESLLKKLGDLFYLEGYRKNKYHIVHDNYDESFIFITNGEDQCSRLRVFKNGKFEAIKIYPVDTYYGTMLDYVTGIPTKSNEISYYLLLYKELLF